jgi:hypothetical protein
MAEKDLTITSLAGGMNNTDSPSDLADDQCVLLENIELFQSALGERRNGCGPLDLTDSGLDTEDTIVYLAQWFPFNDVLNPEFFAVAATLNVSQKFAVRTRGLWRPIVPINPPNLRTEEAYGYQTQSLNGKLFVAYHNDNGWDRLQVWDGTTFRQAGLTEIATPPTAVDEGVGTFSGVRYYRIRSIVKDGDVVKRRSEPSGSVTFTPSGTGAGATVTAVTLPGEGETHWELEASQNDADYYRIATIAAATLTFNDEIPYATGYAAGGTLSEAIGTYLPIPMVRYLAVDGDRLIVGGHWTDETKKSTVGWTPVLNDPGAGNDERLPLSVNNTVTLDNYDGGPLTGLVAGAMGTWYAFKWKRIYKFTRTGDVNRAYENMTLSSTRGAIPGSIIRGVDETGAGCFYFLDPSLGPSRLGAAGLQVIVGLRETWGRVNLCAWVIARGVYYPDKQQVHWWLAVDGANLPNYCIKLQVNEIRPQAAVGGNGIGRGWTVATGRIAEAQCAAVFTEVVTINGVLRVSDRPMIGLSAPDFIQRCDTERTDAGIAYRAIIRTRPYVLAGLLNKWGAMTAALLAIANATATVVVKFIRDFGLETNPVTTGLAPVASETEVVKTFDDLAMSGAAAIEIEICDP